MNASKKKTAIHTAIDWNQLNWKKINRYIEKMKKQVYEAELLTDNRKVRYLQRQLVSSNASLLYVIESLFPKTHIKPSSNKSTIFTYIKEFKKTDAPSRKKQETIVQHILLLQKILALQPQLQAKCHKQGLVLGHNESLQEMVQSITDVQKDRGKWVITGHISIEGTEQIRSDFFPGSNKLFQNSECMHLIKLCLQAENMHAQLQINKGIQSFLANFIIYERLCEFMTVFPHNNETKNSLFQIYAYNGNIVIFCYSKKVRDELYMLFRSNPFVFKWNCSHISKGFTYLNFHFQEKVHGNKTLIICKLAKPTVQAIKRNLSDTVTRLAGGNVLVCIEAVNQIIKENAYYLRLCTNKECAREIDYHLTKIQYKFLRRLHPKKNWNWIRTKYYKKFPGNKKISAYRLIDPRSRVHAKKLSDYN